MEDDNQIIAAIATLTSDVTWIKAELNDIKTNHLDSIESKIELLKDCVGKRPQWITTIVVSVLGSILVGLAVYALTH